MPRAASASTTGALTPTAPKDCCDKLFVSLLGIRDRRLENTRRRNEKLNLTGRNHSVPVSHGSSESGRALVPHHDRGVGRGAARRPVVSDSVLAMTIVDEMETRIAAGLRARRLELGLSLGEVAELSGVSKAMVAKVEAGAAPPPPGAFGRPWGGA